jgi:hypothetical protein
VQIARARPVGVGTAERGGSVIHGEGSGVHNSAEFGIRGNDLDEMPDA